MTWSVRRRWRGTLPGLVALGLVLAGCGSDGGSSPALAASSGGVPARFGFGTVRVLVRGPGGQLTWCFLLASTDVQRERGLMEVTDPTLGGHDGMFFRYPADSSGGYWMRNTPMPLSIAYLGSDGHVVSTADMAPCHDRADCPIYPVAGPYRAAIEVPQGRLDDLGITAAATVVDTGEAC